jgi:hypothetical protein
MGNLYIFSYPPGGGGWGTPGKFDLKRSLRVVESYGIDQITLWTIMFSVLDAYKYTCKLVSNMITCTLYITVHSHINAKRIALPVCLLYVVTCKHDYSEIAENIIQYIYICMNSWISVPSSVLYVQKHQGVFSTVYVHTVTVASV